ncbi:MAG: HEAT repeat domain-containing protein [Thermoanaerobaculia bacterium]|jgi:hypothetical protein
MPLAGAREQSLDAALADLSRVLLSWARSDDSVRRATAIEMLARMGAPEYIDARDALRGDTDPEVHRALIYSMTLMEDRDLARPILLDDIESPDFRDVRDAVYSMNELGLQLSVREATRRVSPRTAYGAEVYALLLGEGVLHSPTTALLRELSANPKLSDSQQKYLRDELAIFEELAAASPRRAPSDRAIARTDDRELLKAWFVIAKGSTRSAIARRLHALGDPSAPGMLAELIMEHTLAPNPATPYTDPVNDALSVLSPTEIRRVAEHGFFFPNLDWWDSARVAGFDLSTSALDQLAKMPDANCHQVLAAVAYGRSDLLTTSLSAGLAEGAPFVNCVVNTMGGQAPRTARLTAEARHAAAATIFRNKPLSPKLVALFADGEDFDRLWSAWEVAPQDEELLWAIAHSFDARSAVVRRTLLRDDIFGWRDAFFASSQTGDHAVVSLAWSDESTSPCRPSALPFSFGGGTKGIHVVLEEEVPAETRSTLGRATNAELMRAMSRREKTARRSLPGRTRTSGEGIEDASTAVLGDVTRPLPAPQLAQLNDAIQKRWKREIEHLVRELHPPGRFGDSYSEYSSPPPGAVVTEDRLGLIGPRAVPFLIEYLSTSDVRTRHDVALLLWSVFEDERGPALLMHDARNGSAIERASALHHLAALRWHDAANLFRAALNDREPAIRASGVGGAQLLCLEDTYATIESLVFDPDPYVVECAIAAIAATQRPGSWRAILPLLDGPPLPRKPRTIEPEPDGKVITVAPDDSLEGPASGPDPAVVRALGTYPRAEKAEMIDMIALRSRALNPSEDAFVRLCAYESALPGFDARPDDRRRTIDLEKLRAHLHSPWIEVDRESELRREIERLATGLEPARRLDQLWLGAFEMNTPQLRSWWNEAKKRPLRDVAFDEAIRDTERYDGPVSLGTFLALERDPSRALVELMLRSDVRATSEYWDALVRLNNVDLGAPHRCSCELRATIVKRWQSAFPENPNHGLR